MVAVTAEIEPPHDGVRLGHQIQRSGNLPECCRKLTLLIHEYQGGLRMERITFKQLLNRIASQHLDQKTQQYIQELEAVVAAVEQVKEIEKLEGGKDLMTAIEVLKNKYH